MLGKRFRRTTSMSHMGPCSPVAASAGAGDPGPHAAMQGASNPHTFPCKTARPLLLEPPAYTGYGAGPQARSNDDAHLAVAVELLGGLVPSALQKQRPCPMEEVCCAVDVVCDEMKIEGMNSSDKGDQGKSMICSAISNSRWGIHGSVAVAGGVAGGHGFPAANPMVIWPRSSFHGGQGNARGDQTSPSGFLDVCFYCKRRLRQERDIYMYRGDTAFCSEECRHRQITIDEQRAARVSSSRRGAAARPRSETAVAA